MSSKKFLSKALNAVSALASTGVLVGVAPHTSAWAMDDLQENAPQQAGLPTIQKLEE